METSPQPPKAKTKCKYTPEQRDASGLQTRQRQGLAADNLRGKLRHAQIYAGAPLLVLLVISYLFHYLNTEDKLVFHNAQTPKDTVVLPQWQMTGRGRSQDLPGPPPVKTPVRTPLRLDEEIYVTKCNINDSTLKKSNKLMKTDVPSKKQRDQTQIRPSGSLLKTLLLKKKKSDIESSSKYKHNANPPPKTGDQMIIYIQTQLPGTPPLSTSTRNLRVTSSETQIKHLSHLPF